MAFEHEPNYPEIDKLVAENPGLKIAIKDDSILLSWFNPRGVRGVDMAFLRLEENDRIPEEPIIAIKYTPYRGIDQDGGFADEALGRTVLNIQPVNSQESTYEVTDSFYQLYGPVIVDRVLSGLDFAYKGLSMGALDEYEEFENRQMELAVERPVLRIDNPLKDINYMRNKLMPYKEMRVAS